MFISLFRADIFARNPAVAPSDVERQIKNALKELDELADGELNELLEKGLDGKKARFHTRTEKKVSGLVEKYVVEAVRQYSHRMEAFRQELVAGHLVGPVKDYVMRIEFQERGQACRAGAGERRGRGGLRLCRGLRSWGAGAWGVVL